MNDDYLIALYPGAVFKRQDSKYGHPEAAIRIPAEDGTLLSGWFYNRGEGTPLVAMYCGNGMNAGDFNFIASRDKTRSYLLINYRGYGSSQGIPTESNIVADARHCLQYARRQLNNRPGPLFLVGYSLGSGVAIQVAAAEKPARLVLITPFDRYARVDRDGLRAKYPGLADWNSAAVAPRITCPVTIMRAEFDTIVSPDSTAVLVQAFRKPPLVLVYPSGHNDILFAPDFMKDFKQQLEPEPEKRWPRAVLIFVLILLSCAVAACICISTCL